MTEKRKKNLEEKSHLELVNLVLTIEAYMESSIECKIKSVKRKYIKMKEHVEKLKKQITEKNKIIAKLAKAKGDPTAHTKIGRQRLQKRIDKGEIK